MKGQIDLITCEGKIMESTAVKFRKQGKSHRTGGVQERAETNSSKFFV